MDATPVSIVGGFVFVSSTLVGLVVWMLKRLIEKTVPEQNELFRSEMEKERQMCRDAFATMTVAIVNAQTAIGTLGAAIVSAQTAIQANQVTIVQALKIISEHHDMSLGFIKEWREKAVAK